MRSIGGRSSNEWSLTEISVASPSCLLFACTISSRALSCYAAFQITSAHLLKPKGADPGGFWARVSCALVFAGATTWKPVSSLKVSLSTCNGLQSAQGDCEPSEGARQPASTRPLRRPMAKHSDLICLALRNTSGHRSVLYSPLVRIDDLQRLDT